MTALSTTIFGVESLNNLVTILTKTWGDSHAQAFAPVTLALARYVLTVIPSATQWSRGIKAAGYTPTVLDLQLEIPRLHVVALGMT